MSIFSSPFGMFSEVEPVNLMKDSQDLAFYLHSEKICTSERKALDFGLVESIWLWPNITYEKTTPYHFQVNLHSLGDHTVIEVKQDIQTITREEFASGENSILVIQWTSGNGMRWTWIRPAVTEYEHSNVWNPLWQPSCAFDAKYWQSHWCMPWGRESFSFSNPQWNILLLLKGTIHAHLVFRRYCGTSRAFCSEK